MSLSALWSGFLWLLRALWACRVSVLSAGAGLVLFGGVVQAQNLLTDTSWNINAAAAVGYWTLFFLAVFLIWAFPVHYGARRILDDRSWVLSAHLRAGLGTADADRLCDQEAAKHETLTLVLPRLLGMLPFLAIAIGLYFARRSVEGARELQEGQQARSLILSLAGGDAATAALFLWFILRRKALVRWLRKKARARRSPRRPLRRDPMDLLSLICVITTIAIFLSAYLFPVLLASYFPRALMVPFLLGALVLPLSVLARSAHDHGKPYLLLAALICIFATAINRGFHDVRTVTAEPAPKVSRQMDVGDALAAWKEANGCGVEHETCPPAVIVAAEGGASRAAFMEATVVGALLDRVSELHDDRSLVSPGRRIFAISGVSGGAFGAIVVHAALADASRGDGGPPCRRAPMTWFRTSEAPRNLDLVRSNWRYCLQALVSGDYLSPAFVGTAFRDVFAPPLHKLWPALHLDDRAGLLEEAWDRHYDWVTRADAHSYGVGSPCDEADLAANRGLCRRFGYSGEFEGHGTWVPLLFLNGTSVETGRRIVAGELTPMPVKDPNYPCGPLYPAAYDLFEVLGDAARADVSRYEAPTECRANMVSPPHAPDLRLSTAALVSARFPIISPAGHIHPANDPTYGDRVVDGGYFENAGLTTALDVAAALEERNVRSVILWVSNDPVLDPKNIDSGKLEAVSPLFGLSADDHILVRAFGTLGAPIDALYATRDGHAAESAHRADAMKIAVYHVQIFGEVGLDPDAAPNPGDLRRCAELWQWIEKSRQPLAMTKLSMSWWLSPAVQADIDAQLCAQKNLQALGDLIGTLARGSLGGR